MAKIGYFNSVLADDGTPKQATITVYIAGTSTPATIWADAGGTIVKDNPFQTDSLGRFQFFASAGAYDVQVSGTGITTYKIENIQLSDIIASTQLTDMPASLTGQAGKGLKVNTAETAYELFLRNFLALTDVPAAYTGKGGYKVKVKSSEDGLEFVADSAGTPVPAGMIAIFDAACPSGWTRVSAWDGKYLKGGATYGGTGGALTHAHGPGTYAHAHIHQINPEETQSGDAHAGDWKPIGTGAAEAAPTYHHHHVDIPEFASGAASSSAITGSSETVNHEPPYIEVVFCKKD